MSENKKSRLRQFIKRALSPNGGVCFDVSTLFILFVFFMAVAWSIPFTQPWITYSNLNSMSKIIVEDVEFRGKVDGRTQDLINKKLSAFNLKDKAPKWTFTGDVRGDGKIQLQDEFVFEITVTDTLKFANFLSGGFSIDIPITKKIHGYSENYYRDSEL